MALSTTNAKITFTFDRAEVFQKICDVSALNAKYVNEEINTDSLIMTADEQYFFDSNIENVVSSLATYFVRISSNEDTYTIDDSSISLTFNAREGAEKQYSKVEVDILHSLVKDYIVTEILRLWYTSVAANEIFGAKYASESASLDRKLRIALFQFYKPVHTANFFDCIRVVGEHNSKVAHINNRSDFVLVWYPKDGTALPDKFSITFYTTGAETYEVNYPSVATPANVIPIVGDDGIARSAHIIFDLSTSANYFSDGRLRYTMVADIANPMFADGFQTVESSDELPFEIWGGPSDSVAKIKAEFIPAYAKLTLADLTEAEIKILQGPALDAAMEASGAATQASEAASLANEATQNLVGAVQAANDAAAYATQSGGFALEARDKTLATENYVKTEEAKREKAELARVANEQVRMDAESKRQTDSADILGKALVATNAATNAADAAEKERLNLVAFTKELEEKDSLRDTKEVERQSNETERINRENERIGAENIRVANENVRIHNENVRQTNEQQRIDNEDTRKTNEEQRQEQEAKRQTDSATAVSNADVATASATAAAKSANDAAASANEVVATLEEFKNETTERVDDLEVKIDRVFDGGRADSVYGPAVRVINCGGANN